ncbi:hypothetical protein [Arthrobacter sp. MA-N2]|uniref:hypothetical protein n=1 Tax=Arthrobacter sp. MA-N2 TaxID=1101188 RepID=UPI00048072F7|nr:hypothetical protein [Arthrobacter sp. MA-N2]
MTAELMPRNPVTNPTPAEVFRYSRMYGLTVMDARNEIIAARHVIRVGDLVRNDQRVLGTVTHVRYAASTTPLSLTVCTGPTAYDLIHPAPADVRKVA